MPKVFLSYSSHDETMVKKLAQGLEAAHCDVWFDHDLEGGEIWWDAILENIRLTDVFLFATSDWSQKSKPCQEELEYAKALNRPLLPVRVGPISSVITGLLAHLQIVDFSPADAQSGFAVLAAVDQAAKKVSPLPDPLPPPPPIPYAYLKAVGLQIDSVDLSSSEQKAVVEQLRRALDEETDDNVRREILVMLRNLDSKAYRNQWTEKQIKALFVIHANLLPGAPPDDPGSGSSTSTTPQEKSLPPAPAGEGDPYANFIKGLAEKVEGTTPPDQTGWPGWRLAENPAGNWKGAYQGAEPARPAEPYSSPAGPPPPPRQPIQPGPVLAPQPAFQQWAPASQLPPPPTVAPPATRPPNFWAMSIVSFFLSYLFGGIAMYFSYQVGQLYSAGNLAGAQRASRLAKIWGIVGIVIGSIVIFALINSQGV